jgi:peptide/nickel transport system ATP-binding protein
MVVLAFNMLGDGLRDALDPKLKQSRVMGKKRKLEDYALDFKDASSDKPDDEILLDVRDVAVNYVLEDEIVEAVNGISFSLKKGQTLGLVGETGAGKTSTALSILNLVQTPPGVIKSGGITVCGHEMLKLTKKQLEKVRGKDISMIFQDPMTALNPVMTVGEQIAESIKYHEGISISQAMEKAGEMLELVGIPADRLTEYPHQFSGGMKQRVVIAIALACNPKILLMDEPTTALDVTIQAQILDLMGDLKKNLGAALLMITHDLGVVAKVCDSVAVVYAGKIVEYGTLEDVFNEMMHPYTEGLFTSLPNVKEKDAKLIPIPGLMPDPTKLPAGCAFEPRCRYAADKCKEPCVAHAVSETHTVLCSRYDEPEFHIDANMNFVHE